MAWGEFIHSDVRPLLHMLDAHEGALARSLGQMIRGWELALNVPEAAEDRAAQLIGAYLVRVGDQAVILQDRAWRKLERKDVQTFRAARIDWARRQGAAMAVGLTASMRRRVADILAAGLKADLTPDQLRRQIREIIPALPGIDAQRRAELIARTELHNAATWAQAHEAKSLAARGAHLVKVWTATMDNRTRRAHRQANGQVREINQDFSVGGARMSRPGDPRGGAHNCVRCRCVCRYIPRGYVAEDRQRRAADMIRVAKRQPAAAFIDEIAAMTELMDPGLAAVVRRDARASEAWAASEAATEAAAEAAAVQDPGN